jgi:hypothetical protein
VYGLDNKKWQLSGFKGYKGFKRELSKPNRKNPYANDDSDKSLNTPEGLITESKCGYLLNSDFRIQDKNLNP